MFFLFVLYYFFSLKKNYIFAANLGFYKSFYMVNSFFKLSFSNLNFMSQLYTFHVRKFSQLRSCEEGKETETNLKNLTANRWFHYPQRSNICLNIFRYQKSNCSTYFSVTWKGTVLVCICMYMPQQSFLRMLT